MQKINSKQLVLTGNGEENFENLHDFLELSKYKKKLLFIVGKFDKFFFNFS